MVARLGVGATTASAVIFSVLLVSNLLVFAASQDRERLYSQSNAADSLGDQAAVLMAAGGVNVLLEAQTLFGAGVLGCPGALSAAGWIVGQLSDHQRSGGLALDVSAGVAEGGLVNDNLSMLAPFNGSVPGDVDISLAMAASGADNITGATLSRTEFHVVHLPVRLQSLAADCVSAFARVSDAVSNTPAPNCTVGAITPVMEALSRGPASSAAADGFGFSLGFSVTSGAVCTVGLQVSLQQPEVQGPGGPFTVRVQEGGLVAFGQPSSPQRA